MRLTKAAIEVLSRFLAQLARARGITVNAVALANVFSGYKMRLMPRHRTAARPISCARLTGVNGDNPG